MENDELKSFVSDCSEKMNGDPLIYESVFLKVYVKFELFISKIFTKYALGKTNENGFVPERKLCFSDEQQLFEVINGTTNKEYIDYLKVIQTIGNHIFQNNPFSVLFEIAEYNTILRQCIAIRNCIAHESDSSKKKYQECCLVVTKPYVDPGVYLSSINKHTSKTYYTFYVSKLIEISELILDPVEN